MAVTHWQLGRASGTTATVVVRADANEEVTVSITGQSVPVACATAVNDGNAVATFSGLAPGTRYAYTINGSPAGTLRTMQAGPPYWVAISSCWKSQQGDPIARRLLDAVHGGAHGPLLTEMSERLCAFVNLGDWVYMNVNGTVNGYALSRVDSPDGTLANCKDVGIRRNYYRAGALRTGLKELIRSVPTYMIKDDHEFDPDNASYSLAWLQGHYGSAVADDLPLVWAAAQTAFRDWTQGNPSSEVSGCDAFSFDVGPVRFYATDMITERDYTGDADSAAKRMISDAQEQWLLNGMAAHSGPKVWLSSKQFISSCGRNGDGFTDLGGNGRGYRTQLTRILSDPRFPRAGCLSITGDEHLRSDMRVSADQFGGSHAAISQISAGPATIDVITDPNDGLTYRAGVRDKERDTSGLSNRGENNYVLLRVLADRVERYVLGSRYGLRYMGYVGTQDNLVRR